VNHAIKQRVRAFSPCTVRVKMLQARAAIDKEYEAGDETQPGNPCLCGTGTRLAAFTHRLILICGCPSYSATIAHGPKAAGSSASLPFCSVD